MNICLVLHKYGVRLDDPCCYPLGFMYVSSYLQGISHTVKVLNYNLWDYDLKEEIKGQDVVYFTGFEEFKQNILRDEQVCIEAGVKTTLGGALATFDGIPEFKGFKFKGEIDNVSSCAFPDYSGFGINEYHKRHPLRYMGVLASRGCPYSCTFCAQTCKFNLRPVFNVLHEIKCYSFKYSLDMIVFNDNTFNINKSRFMQFCSQLRVPWSAAIRCQPFDEEMAIAAKKSNCKYFVVGVESFNQDKLNRMNKKIKVKQIKRTLDLLEKYKINYHGNILVGFDNETYSDIADEIRNIPSEYKVFPAMVQPFIGTKDGKKRSVSKKNFSKLSTLFNDYATQGGKSCYPQLES